LQLNKLSEQLFLYAIIVKYPAIIYNEANFTIFLHGGILHMKAKVMYYSRSGNTKKVADAIAQAVGHTSEAVPPAYPFDNVKLLFLGAGVYGGKVDKKMTEYIRTLDAANIKNVALFSTMASQDKGIPLMRQLLQEKGINVLEESFICPGKFFVFFKRNHPSAEDLKNAQAFAKRAMDRVKE
jgi:flavodoxin